VLALLTLQNTSDPHVPALMFFYLLAGGVWLTPPRWWWLVLLLCWVLHAVHR
jgi:hypothetical protein